MRGKGQTVAKPTKYLVVAFRSFVADSLRWNKQGCLFGIRVCADGIYTLRDDRAWVALFYHLCGVVLLAGSFVVVGCKWLPGCPRMKLKSQTRWDLANVGCDGRCFEYANGVYN